MDENPYLPPQVASCNAPPVAFYWSGILSVAIGVVGSAVLVFAFSHFQVDRTNRRPLVTFVGLAARWVWHLIASGLALSVFSFVLGYRSCKKLNVHSVPGAIGVVIALANVSLTLGCLGAAYED